MAGRDARVVDGSEHEAPSEQHRPQRLGLSLGLAALLAPQALGLEQPLQLGLTAREEAPHRGGVE